MRASRRPVADSRPASRVADRVAAADPHPWRSALLRAALRVTPSLGHAVVTGFPDDEGNSVEVVRALARHVPVYWLVAGTRDEVSWLVEDAEGADRIHVVAKSSPAAYAAYLTASWVFFTHGLFGSPHPPAHKTFVNVWHGDGPKRRKGFADVGSTYIVSGTRLWGEMRADHFDMPEDRVLVTGYPRVDQMHRPAPPEALRALGLDPDRPLVLLMPTYRTTDAPSQRVGEALNWSDGDELSRSEESRALLASAARAAEERGLTLAVKPHPLDADRFEGTGIRRLDNADLGRARITLYQLLGSTAGLITDYSSVWPDYLTVDRPIGFYCPDLDVFEAERGLNVEGYRDLVPGPLLARPVDFEAFLDQCRSESAASRALRHERGVAIGAVTRPGAARRLLVAVGVERARR